MSDARERWEQASREFMRECFDNFARQQDDEQEFQMQEMSGVTGEMGSWLMSEGMEVVFFDDRT